MCSNIVGKMSGRRFSPKIASGTPDVSSSSNGVLWWFLVRSTARDFWKKSSTLPYRPKLATKFERTQAKNQKMWLKCKRPNKRVLIRGLPRVPLRFRFFVLCPSYNLTTAILRALEKHVAFSYTFMLLIVFHLLRSSHATHEFFDNWSLFAHRLPVDGGGRRVRFALQWSRPDRLDPKRRRCQILRR